MIPEERSDYVDKLEKALFEYVEKYGATNAVRQLYRVRETGHPFTIDEFGSPKEEESGK